MAKKKRVSPMKGRKISEEDRGPNAPKLGRPFREGVPTKKFVVTLSLPPSDMKKFLKKSKTSSKAQAITKLIKDFI